MVQPIVHDTFFLRQKSEPATKADKQIITDLTDTLLAHADHCSGLAANMIGVKKRIIVYANGESPGIMINPVIVGKTGPYETEEGCLSLEGTRKTTRYRTIEVEYLDKKFRKQKKLFHDWTAQIIQHEMDHCEGILI